MFKTKINYFALMNKFIINSLKSNSTLMATHVMWLSTFLIFIFLMLRSGGIYPVVFADEWAYSSYSRLHKMQDVGVPSYLYFILYKITNTCGDGFLECARVLNGTFISLSIPIIYRIARRFCSTWPALLVAVLSVIGPSNSYAIYFMPEAMYFFGFWLLTLIALKRNVNSLQIFAIQLGVALGFLSLIKIHALFLLPTLILYILLKAWRVDKNNFYKIGILSTLSIIISFSVTKLAIGFMFAGRDGLNVLGSLYKSQAQAVDSKNNFFELLTNIILNLSGHVMALVVMFGLPLAVILNGTLRNSTSKINTNININININKTIDKNLTYDLIVYTVLIFIPLLLITSYFTALVAGNGPYENISRLHMRYYNFAFPLFYLIAITQLKIDSNLVNRSLTTTLLVLLIACLSFWLLVPNFIPSMVDSPELRGFTHNIDFYKIFALMGMATTLAWVYDASKSAKFFVFILLPIVILFGSWKVTTEVRVRQLVDVYDEAGLYAKRNLRLSTSNLMVIAPNTAGLLRTLFHIDSLKTQSMELKTGSTIDITTLPSGVSWLLLIGDYDVPDAENRRFSLGKFSILPIIKNHNIDFKQSTWPGVVERTKGLSHSESWGTWSIGPEVYIELSTPLPKNFRLTLDANAFSSNASEEFKIKIGNENHSFKLKTETQSISFEFALATDERIIRIYIPKPKSPKSIGIGDDVREIGIGLRNMQINVVN
jgi:phosphoglycerol transferase